MLGLFFQFKDYFNRFLAKIGLSKQRNHRNPMTCKDLLPIKQWPWKLGPAILPIDHWSWQLNQPCSPLEHRSRKSGHGFSYTTLEHWQDIQRLWNSLAFLNRFFNLRHMNLFHNKIYISQIWTINKWTTNMHISNDAGFISNQ